MPSVLNLIELAAVFVVLMPCIWFALEQTTLRSVNPVLAPAATFLCVLALQRGGATPRPWGLMDTVLVLWMALGLSILFVLLLWLLSRLKQWFDGDASEEWCEHAARSESFEWRECSGETEPPQEERAFVPRE